MWGIMIIQVLGDFFGKICPEILLMEESGDHQLGCIKPFVNNGINCQAQLINSSNPMIDPMGLEYLPTFVVDFHDKLVCKYTSPMDAMGMESWDDLKIHKWSFSSPTSNCFLGPPAHRVCFKLSQIDPPQIKINQIIPVDPSISLTDPWDECIFAYQFANLPNKNQPEMDR